MQIVNDRNRWRIHVEYMGCHNCEEEEEEEEEEEKKEKRKRKKKRKMKMKVSEHIQNKQTTHNPVRSPVIGIQ